MTFTCIRGPRSPCCRAELASWKAERDMLDTRGVESRFAFVGRITALALVVLTALLAMPEDSMFRYW